MTDPATITDDTPLRLAVAADLAFPQGGMTASGLRKESARGRLAIERIAGKDYTTLRAIAEMRQLCRVAPKDQDSGSNQPEKTAASRRGGSSATDQSNEALAQARAKLQKLKAPCETTSTKKPRHAPATVIPLRSE